MAKKQKLAPHDLKLVNDISAAMQEEKHRGLWWGVILLFSICTVFLIWAYNSTLEEVVTGQGSIIPSSRQQVIQSLDGGILKELKVHEGEEVQKGQELVVLDDTRTSAILGESQAKMINLEAMLARYKAEAYGTKLSFPAEITPALRQRETSAYNARKQALNQTVAGLTQSKKLLDERIRRTSAMVARGVSSQIELLNMQQQSADILTRINDAKNQYLTDANENVVKTEAELAQARENVARNADPVTRAILRSPVHGIVNNIKVNTVGGVINAGQEIMEVVPIGDKLLVQAYIRPQDVAFLRTGLDATVKVSAYDYSIYGGLQGKVTLLSPDTLQDERRASQLNLDASQSYYRVLIETDGSQITDKNGKPLDITPGMSVTVDIKTGEKTVFDYLIKPLTRLKSAMRER